LHQNEMWEYMNDDDESWPANSQQGGFTRTAGSVGFLKCWGFGEGSRFFVSFQQLPAAAEPHTF
jgi:hypothetical protein